MQRRPLSLEASAILLAKKKITTNPFHPVSLLQAVEMCGRTPTFKIVTINKHARVVTNPLMGSANLVIQTAERQAGASGVSNVEEVTEECRDAGTKIGENQVKEILEHFADVNFLVENWFWQPGAAEERNRLQNVTRKMLSVASSIDIRTLREGVRRAYTGRRSRGSSKWRLLVPPRNVLEGFYRAHRISRWIKTA
jgi:hypothetical protein